MQKTKRHSPPKIGVRMTRLGTVCTLLRAILIVDSLHPGSQDALVRNHAGLDRWRRRGIRTPNPFGPNGFQVRLRNYLWYRWIALMRPTGLQFVIASLYSLYPRFVCTLVTVTSQVSYFAKIRRRVFQYSSVRRVSFRRARDSILSFSRWQYHRGFGRGVLEFDSRRQL